MLSAPSSSPVEVINSAVPCYQIIAEEVICCSKAGLVSDRGSGSRRNILIKSHHSDPHIVSSDLRAWLNQQQQQQQQNLYSL